MDQGKSCVCLSFFCVLEGLKRFALFERSDATELKTNFEFASWKDARSIGQIANSSSAYH